MAFLWEDLFQYQFKRNYFTTQQEEQDIAKTTSKSNLFNKEFLTLVRVCIKNRLQQVLQCCLHCLVPALPPTSQRVHTSTKKR